MDSTTSRQSRTRKRLIAGATLEELTPLCDALYDSPELDAGLDGAVVEQRDRAELEDARRTGRRQHAADLRDLEDALADVELERSHRHDEAFDARAARSPRDGR